MKSKDDLVSSWMNKADADLKVARNELEKEDSDVYFAVCFHAQQAAEKYLKGYTIFLDLAPDFTHEIGELIENILQKDENIGEIQLKADELTEYAVEIRYPDTESVLSEKESKEAVNIAELVRNYVQDKIR